MHRRSNKDKEHNARLLRAWKAFHRERFEQALAGIHHAVFERLQLQLEQLHDARELINSLAAEDWSVVDANTRLIALHEINAAICKLREKSGMEPISDPLPSEQDNAFRIIKRLFESFPSHAGKTTESVR